MKFRVAQPRAPVALCVLALHLVLGWALLQPNGQRVPERSRPIALRLVPLPPPKPIDVMPQRQAPAVNPVRTALPRVPVPEVQTATTPSPQAITAIAAEPLPAASAAPAASAPLDLRLPKAHLGQGEMTPARQAQMDGRANSPRPSVGETMLGITANQRIEMADGGAMIIGPQGGCIRYRPNEFARNNPMNANAQSLPGTASACSTAPGARRHARPP